MYFKKLSGVFVRFVRRFPDLLDGQQLVYDMNFDATNTHDAT
jgi:hypothetical protein